MKSFTFFAIAILATVSAHPQADLSASNDDIHRNLGLWSRMKDGLDIGSGDSSALPDNIAQDKMGESASSVDAKRTNEILNEYATKFKLNSGERAELQQKFGTDNWSTDVADEFRGLYRKNLEFVPEPLETQTDIPTMAPVNANEPTPAASNGTDPIAYEPTPAANNGTDLNEADKAYDNKAYGTAPPSVNAIPSKRANCHKKNRKM